jgi:hypothetical protein
MRRTHLIKVLVAILLVVGLLTPSAVTVRLKKTDSSVPATSHNTRRKETSSQDLAASN